MTNMQVFEPAEVCKSSWVIYQHVLNVYQSCNDWSSRKTNDLLLFIGGRTLLLLFVISDCK